MPQDAKPAPPPEATLIRLAREAARIKASAAARSAGISTAHWSQVEVGYERRGGQYKPVTGTRATIAHMARAVGLTPDRLEAVGRADAAEVLGEIIAQETANEPDDDGVDEVLAESFEMMREFIDWWERLTPAQRTAERRRIRGDEPNGNRKTG